MGRASLRTTVLATLPVVPQGCFAFSSKKVATIKAISTEAGTSTREDV